VIADLLTDFPERFDDLETLIAVAPDGSQRSLQIEEHWFQGRRVVFKFAGYDSIEAAKEFAGLELAVPASERVELAADQFYESELKGCRVEAVDGEVIGSVSEVMRTGGVEILVVKNDSGREFLVPMAHEICVEIDVNQRLIRIDPPPGLLEL
jgi:16S rRNA processing protein RimM